MAKINKLIRQKIYDRDMNKCLVCGSPDNLTIDHIVPLSLGGANNESNYQTLCCEHNRKKGNKPIDYRKGKPVRLIRKEYGRVFKWVPERKNISHVHPMKQLRTELKKANKNTKQQQYEE